MTDDSSTDIAQPPLTPHEAYLIQWLADRDVECPSCRYNLRNLTTPRCPECGEPLQLTVSLAEPYFKAWIALMGALSGGAGVGLLVLISIARGEWWQQATRLHFAFFLFLAMIPAAALAAWKRHRLQRMSHQKQWLLAIVAILAFLTAVGLAFNDT